MTAIVLSGPVRRFLPDAFTSALVATLVVATLLPAGPSAAGAVSAITNAAIALMFFLYGTKLAPSRVIGGMTHWRLQLLIFATTFVAYPILGAGFFLLPEGLLPHDLVVGLVFLTLLPSTIQSCLAFTSIAGGNVAAAMCAATFSNIAGTVVTPILVGLVLSLSGGAGALSAILEIAELIVAPFVVGQFARPLVGGFVGRHPRLIAITDRSSILLIVYGAFGRAVRQGLWSIVSVREMLIVFALEAVLLAVTICGLRFVSRRLGFDRSDEAAAVFCGAKKSLASGVPMAGVLFAANRVGIVLLPIMLFHQMELMVGSWLSRRYAKAAAERDGAVGEVRGA